MKTKCMSLLIYLSLSCCYFVIGQNVAQCQTFYKPVIIDSIAVPGNAYDMDFSNYSGIDTDIFLACGSHGIYKVDQDLNSSQQISSSWTWRGEISNKNDDDGWMYFASDLNSFYVYYIGNNNESYFVDIQDRAGEIKEISSDQIIVLSWDGAVSLYTNQNTPYLLDSVDLSSSLDNDEHLYYLDVVNEEYAYIASNQDKLFLVQVTNNNLQVNLISAVSNDLSDIEDIAIHNNDLYIIDFLNRLIKYDISDKMNPVLEQEMIFQEQDEAGQYISIVQNKLFCSSSQALYQCNYNYNTSTFDINQSMRFNEPWMINSRVATHSQNNYLRTGGYLYKIYFETIID